MMAKMASADIMCVGPKSVREKFTGIIRYVSSFYHCNVCKIIHLFIKGKVAPVPFYLDWESKGCPSPFTCFAKMAAYR